MFTNIPKVEELERSAFDVDLFCRTERRFEKMYTNLANILCTKKPCDYITQGWFRLLAFFFLARCEFREVGTPEARNLISVRCGFTVYLFLEGGENKREMGTPQARNPVGVISR